LAGEVSDAAAAQLAKLKAAVPAVNDLNDKLPHPQARAAR
jgi:hypothetical protein